MSIHFKIQAREITASSPFRAILRCKVNNKISDMEQQEIKKSNRGGARAGAGRKRVADRECMLAFGVSHRAKANLAAWAAARSLSLREAANAIFESLDIGN